MFASGGEIEQRNARAFAQQPRGGGAADVPEAPGDGHDLPIQSIQGCPLLRDRARRCCRGRAFAAA
jgi:hypothetical protein